jgi:uncharacterized membrane protein (UPF0127 family)
MKKVLLTLFVLLIVAAGVYYTQNYMQGGQVLSVFKKNAIVTIDNQSFNVSIANSEKDREIGLSETKSLDQNQGMLFLFNNPGYYSFWMKNMKFPIDIIFINNDQIVTIHDNAQIIKAQENPMLYTPTQSSDKVLEIQAGLSEKYNFKIGDKVKYENLGN